MKNLQLRDPLSRLFEENGSVRAPRPVIGVFAGEGVGPEVMRCALDALAALQEATGLRVDVRRGGPIGAEAVARDGVPLPEEAIDFAAEVFGAGGAILCGPGGGRFVYDLRRRFDLFCKLSPVRVHPELVRAGPFRPRHVRDVDLLFVRDNAGGVYQGEWGEHDSPAEGRVAEHCFRYSERQVRRVVEVAARLAVTRTGRICVVTKEGGVPTVSRLWADVAGDTAARYGVACEVANADLIAYRMIREPRAFDVLVTPNMLGDLLIDGAAVLQGSRGLAFSGNFAGGGAAVYQTNHGSAYDLAGTDVANPAAQILSLAMLLRESLSLPREAAVLEQAVTDVWRAGWRTADVAQPGTRTVGTREFGNLVAAAVRRPARDPVPR